MIKTAFLVASVLVGTWNGKWFPSGRAEHRAHPDVEEATISASAKMLSHGISSADPFGTNDIILVLNEMRDLRSASNLVARIGRKGLRIVAISKYRRRDRFDQQQDAIATTLPVVDKGWSVWRNRKNETPPRGYVYADVVVEPAVTAKVYAVHLKSNYGAKSEEAASLNRLKRAHAVEQLESQERRNPYVIIAGDLNADKWREEFFRERIFGIFEGGGYTNFLSLLPPGGRGTHPSRVHGDSALDYIMSKGFAPAGAVFIQPNEGLSDHYAFFALIAPCDRKFLR